MLSFKDFSDQLTESSSQFDPLLVEFWKTRTPEQMKHYFIQDNCFEASEDFLEFLEGKKIYTAEIVPIGTMSKNKKREGWVKTDTVDDSIDAFTKEDLAACKVQKLNPSKAADRRAYIVNNKLEDEFKWVPHSWVENKGKILDPSGFYLDGKSGQFDKMIHDKSNISKRYHYF